MGIKLDKIETSDEALIELNNANKAFNRYLRMAAKMATLNKFLEDLKISSPEYDLMTEEDEIFEHSSIDVTDLLEKHLKSQVIKFKKYCDDLEILAKELKEQEEEVDKFGSATDQARSHYYSTR